MYPTSERFGPALRHSHTVAARVDAYQGARCVHRDLPFSDGSVSVASAPGVHRTLTVTIADPTLWGLLAPVGTELRAYRGIRYPGGADELVPLGVFSLDQQSTAVLAPGGIAITSAPDRWAYVQRAKFETPRASDPGLTCVQSIARLVTEVVAATVDTGGVTFANTLAAAATPLAVWPQDRAGAIADLALASGTEVFFGPTGNLIIRDVATMDSRPAWRIDAGPNGVMLAGTATRDRTRVFNVVVVVSSKTDGTAPFTPQVVEDLDPLSPTNVHGPYGRCPYFLNTALISNAADARKAGRALLARTKGRFVDMGVSAIVNPALGEGDTVSVPDVAGNQQLYLTDSFNLPLSVEGAQALTLRSLAAVTADTST